MIIEVLRGAKQNQLLEVFYKKGVLIIFAKFTGKHMCQCLFFNKVAGVSLQLYSKRDFDTNVFLWILRIFKNTYFKEHLRTTVSDRMNTSEFLLAFMWLIIFLSVIIVLVSSVAIVCNIIGLYERSKYDPFLK